MPVPRNSDATWCPRLLLLTLALLTGCATAAQRQAQQSARATQNASTQFKACIRSVIDKPEYAPLLPHMPDQNTGQLTMAELANEQLPTSEEAKLFASRHDDLNPCKSQFLSALSTARPDIAPIFSGAWTKANAIAVKLVQRKISWGEFGRLSQAGESESRTSLAAANRQWVAGLEVENEAELAHRQAAANAIMQWSLQQQMINAATRPVVTNCNRLGYSLNCTSY